ncbi:MAG: hypothetical protein RL500_1779, partial [Pseudomonadota bacterium]
MNQPIESAVTATAMTAELAQRALAVMPGRQSNLRASPEPAVFVERGLGQRLWDVDG